MKMKTTSRLSLNKLLSMRSAIIAILLIAALALVFFNPLKQTKSFEITDKCGRFMNLISHTIEDKGECETRCASQCEAKDYDFRKVDFEQRDEGCNLCMCYCAA